MWGQRTNGGYRISPGRWTIGGNDGFSRKGEDVWNVEHVTVGSETWTIAKGWSGMTIGDLLKATCEADGEANA